MRNFIALLIGFIGFILISGTDQHFNDLTIWGIIAQAATGFGLMLIAGIIYKEEEDDDEH